MRNAYVKNGRIVMLDREMTIPIAKSMRDDISEAIHEAEGGDPIEWKPVVYERKLKNTMARVFLAKGKWCFRAWVGNHTIVEGDFTEKEEAIAAADAALGGSLD